MLGVRITGVVVFAGTLWAQTHDTFLSGTVVDPSGAFIVHAPVEVADSNGNATERSETGSKGDFRMPAPPAGTYTLIVTAPGFTPAKVPFTMGRLPHTPFAVSLHIAAANTDVSVTASEEVPEITSDTSNNQNANTFSKSALDELPMLDADYLTTISALLDNK